MYQGGSSSSSGASAPSGTGFVRATGGAFVDPAEPLRAADIKNALYLGDTGGSSSAYTVSAPAGFALVDGIVVAVKIHTANASAAQLNVGSTGNKDILKAIPGGITTLQASQLRQYQVAYLAYESSTDGWQLLSARALATGDLPVALRLEAQMSAGQTTTASSNYIILYDTPSVNTTGLTYSSGTWTATIAGVYHVSAIAYSGGGGLGHFELHVNGTAARLHGNHDLSSAMQVFDQVYLGVGDTLRVIMRLNASVALDVTSPQFCYLAISVVH